MKVIKSLFVLCMLLALLFLTIVISSSALKKIKENLFIVRSVLLIIISSSVTLTSMVLWGNYVYPFERKVNLVLVAEYDVAEGYELEFAGARFWHGAYEAYGMYPESRWFRPDNGKGKTGYSWPPLDLEHNSYIISYGQKVESLSYNVWDQLQCSESTGAKVGHVTLSEEFEPSKVYIYRIPKLRIDVDVDAWNTEMVKKVHLPESE